jgi:hypothetical protein
MRGRVLPFCIALGLAAVGTAARIPASQRYLAVDTYEDRYYLPQPEWLGLFCLGYREAGADLIWMRLVVYYGEEIFQRGHEAHVYEYAEAVLALDPDAVGIYRWIGTFGVYRADGASAEEVERAVAIMERGAARFPNDGVLAWRTGATLAFELPPLYGDRPELARRSRERAAPYLVRAAQLGAAPPYALFSNASLLTRIGRSEEAATHLEEMYAVTDDPERRDQIAAYIEHLRSESFATAFVEENGRFEDDWARQMPYAPAAFYDLVRPVPVIDTNAVLHDGFGHHALDGEPTWE